MRNQLCFKDDNPLKGVKYCILVGSNTAESWLKKLSQLVLNVRLKTSALKFELKNAQKGKENCTRFQNHQFGPKKAR